MSIIGTLPNTLTNGTPADATQVMADLNFIVSQVNTNAAPNSGGSITATSITTTQLSTGQLNGGPLAGFRNRIINGAMTVDQRHGGTAYTPLVATGYTIDRWRYLEGVTGATTYQQNLNAVAAPPGFSNYLGLSMVSNYTLTTGGALGFSQRIEAANIQDFVWGSGSAKTVTLGAWVQSSLTGTFGGSVIVNGTWSYPFSYSIPVANTWTFVSFTVPGLTSAAITSYVEVFFACGAGATVSGTANTWANVLYYSVPGAVTVNSTVGATFYLGGVQLEIGTQATPFEARPFAVERRLCMRYFSSSFMDGFSPANPNSLAVQQVGGYAIITDSFSSIPFPEPMRVAPTVTIYAPITGSATGNMRQASNGTIITATANFISNVSFAPSGTSAVNNTGYQFGWAADAEI